MARRAFTSNIDPAALRIEAGYLVEVTNDCTCGGFDTGGGIEHESYCGLEPLASVAELIQVFGPIPTLPAGLDVDTVCRVIAATLRGASIDVNVDDIRPHLSAFLAAVLRGAR
jgi:hypothetical protein